MYKITKHFTSIKDTYILYYAALNKLDKLNDKLIHL